MQLIKCNCADETVTRSKTGLTNLKLNRNPINLTTSYIVCSINKNVIANCFLFCFNIDITIPLLKNFRYLSIVPHSNGTIEKLP